MQIQFSKPVSETWLNWARIEQEIHTNWTEQKKSERKAEKSLCI